RLGGIMSGTSTRYVFTLLGLAEEWASMTDRQPAYELDLGNIQITAAAAPGRSIRPVCLIGGMARGARSVPQIQFECPLDVKNTEQGVAMMAHAIGDDIEPEIPAPWRALGRRWRDRLPCVADARCPPKGDRRPVRTLRPS